MRGRVIAAATLALVAGVACDVGCGDGSGAGGHLRVERMARRATPLMDEPGRAEYCPVDSVLTIIAIGHDRAAGFAVRTALPLREARTFAVQPVLGGVGTATAAFRLVGGSARLGSAGRLRLEPSPGIVGEFEVAVPDSAGIRVRFTGKLSHIPIRNVPPASCPGA
jgi:hypothetical protein